ncbi:MAG: hypothetical protein ABSC60_16500 [Acidobacteriota bacterium]|jgi:hypothetical protein
MYLKKDSVVFIGIFVFLALIMPAMAGDISGTWIARTPNFNVTMVFKVEGTTLTGTVRTHPSDEAEIKDGKINGNKISFYIERMKHQKMVKVRFKGTIVGEEINLTRNENGTIGDIIAKRERSNSSKSNSSNSI